MTISCCCALFLLASSLAAVSALRPALSPLCHAHLTAQKAGVRIGVASHGKGLGAFATRDIKFGEYVGQYKGELLTADEVRARYWGKRVPDSDDRLWIASRHERGQGITGDYVLEMQDGSFVDCEDGDLSEWCRFMNHAQEGTHPCNVKPFVQLETNGPLQPFPHFFASRDIKEGEELSWDYGPLSSCSNK